MLNVAGVADGALLGDPDMALHDRLMDVDLRGVFHGMKHGIRTMLTTGGGSIVNWSSVGGLDGSASTSVYNAAKAALNRAGQPPEVAEVGAFLAWDRASFVTGAVIPVDGDRSAELA